MTRESFIRKWLANKDFQYCEDGRAQMREDLDKVIDHAQQKLNIASVVRPEVESAKAGELLGNGLPKGVSVSEWCLCTDGLCKQLRIGKCKGWLKY